MALVCRKSHPVDSWSHCPGKNNLADLLSRETDLSTLVSNPLWLKEPTWLSDMCSSACDSSAEVEEVSLRDCMSELKVKN